MAAQDAELKLKVSLDLGFFRQQLAGLGQAAAGYNLPVKVQFDRRSVQNELNALGANIRRRSYTLNVNTNLQAEIANAKTLAKELENLGRARAGAQGSIRQQMGMGALSPGPQSGGLSSKDVGKLYRAAVKAGFLELDKEVARKKETMIAALDLVGRDAIAGLLNGLTSQNEQLRNAASSIGETLIKTIKDVLGIASPSREFKKIGENVGEGFQQGMLSSMDKAFDAVEGLMRARMKVLDTIARGMFRMAGIDPAAIRAEAAQRRALPGVNFPATVPRRDIPIGPSGTGRALPPGAIPSALPGTAFGAQRYLPTALSDELKQILRDAAFAFVDSIRTQTRSVRIGMGASMQGMLPAARIAGLLPAGVGREPSRYATGAIGGESREQMMARRTAEAYARSALRGMDVMGGGAGRPPSPYSYAYRSARPTSAIIPYAQPGAIVPSTVSAGGGAAPPGGGGGGFGMGGLGGFGRAIGGINLPGSGAIKELGQEFGYATKQVLLFGQAYKALAFIQNFPSQVGAAVGQLQSFRNTLNAISPTAEEAAASNRLILDLVDKYNVPLQSARDGFTKLYASMAPAGFGGEDIRKIFTGISQAAATFGLSADKVDRVNYAFAQMASKGQVMSEELKGQLGDVLPGAMAIFAEAAGFTGPKAIQEFSAALEAGQYKGEAMVALLKNVGVVLNDEFGPGAEGAARTFQGVINRLQNSIVLLYESFEPVAVSFLNAVVVPLTDGIRQISDGFNVFFTGAAAQSSGGFAIAQELEKLRPTFAGIAQNVQQLIPIFQQFANTALGLGRVLLDVAGNPFVGYLLRAYVAVLPLTLAIQALNLKGLIPLIASFARSIPAFIAYIAATTQGATANKALQLAMVTTGKTAGVTATQIRTVGIALKAAFASTIIGAALLGIGMLIEKIISLNASMADTKAKALGAAQAIRSMSQTEAAQATRQYENGAQSLRGLNKEIEEGKLKGKAWIEVTSQQAKALQDAGIIVSNVRGSLQVQPTRVPGAFQKLEGLAAEGRYQQRQLAFDESQAQQASNLAPIPPGEGAGKGAAAAAPSLESYENLQDQIAKARNEGDLERAKLLFDYQVSLDRRRFDLQESAANDVQKVGIKLAKELFEARVRFDRQVFESGQAIQREAGKVAPGNLPPRAPKGQPGYTAISTQYGPNASDNTMIGQQVGGNLPAPRPVSGSERRDIVAAEKTNQTILTERIRLEQALRDLAEDYAQIIQSNFDVIFPVAQLKLQNELLAARYQLELQAVPREAIDAQLQIAEARAKGQEQQKKLNEQLEKDIVTVQKYSALQEEGIKLTDTQSKELAAAQAFIQAYGSTVAEVTEKVRGFTEAQLENAIANIKQADSLKALEEISGRINDAVQGVTGTFKGFVKEIVTGTDAVDALKKAQEAITDQALTIFLDFAFKPVEDVFKNALGDIFNVPNEEAKRKETLDKLEAQLKEQQRIAAATEKTAANTSPTGGAPALPSGQTQSAAFSIGGAALPAGLTSTSGVLPGGSNSAFFAGGTAPGLSSQDAYRAGASADLFVDTSALSVAGTDWAALSENVDTSLSSVVNSINKNADEAGESGKAGAKWQESLGKVTQGIGIAASSILGIYAGISQIKEGGTGNILSGIGSVLLGVAGGIGGIAGLIPKSGKAAKGAVWNGGFSAFANGGMVKGPTLGLIGEGRYNEAIVPLPDGRSIPVQLNGGRTARDVMGNGSTGGSQGLAIDMKFETTKINGVEYVSREQLEQAMAETRKKAARDGAAQGSQLALSKIKNSPSTRRQLGM